MNVIDFHVTKIISEERDKIYSFYNMTEDQVYDEPEDWWRDYLLSNGVKQTYEYLDEGGKYIDTTIFNTDKNEKPFKVGYVGQH